jgi:hypothetical protein
MGTTQRAWLLKANAFDTGGKFREPRVLAAESGRGWALVDDVGAPRGAEPSTAPMMGPQGHREGAAY